MTIQEILAMVETPAEMIQELKSGRLNDMPDIKKYVDAINPLNHKVMDTTERKDKIIQKEDGSKVPEPVARIALALQKLIVKRSSAFLFGNPVKIFNKTDGEQFEIIHKAIIQILEDVKINSLNRKIARILFSCTEVAELWYPIELEGEDLYGIGSKFKLKMKILNPMKGEVLHPYFDDYGDLVAFSREYSIKKNSEQTTYFEIYTDKVLMKYDVTNGEPVLVEGYPKENPIGKIPIVYASQEQADFEDVDFLINRLEKLLSNFADTNDYHAAPTIFIKGKVLGFAKKGESGKIIEGERDSEAAYLSWQNAPESVKLEIETLLRMIYTISQTPDISFEGVKGLGSSVSGKALRMLFLDAHLKVEDKMEIFDEYLVRRMSIIKAFLQKMNPKLKADLKAIKLESTVTPYMIDDEADRLDIIMTATGNKPVISQKSGVKMAGFSKNAEEEYKQIQTEHQQANAFEIIPTAQ